MKIINNLSNQILKLRCHQIIINELNNNNKFKIPIHLAIGHESIAVSIMNNLNSKDKIILSHRNIHYNLHKIKDLKLIIDEFKLNNKGILKGKYGSMNLFNPFNKVMYSSSILGNNLSVAAGIALSTKFKKDNGFIFVVTGDGAIEEGSFYESLLLISSLELNMIIIIENNQWSLASKINQRRKNIDLEKIANSVGGKYFKFSSNNYVEYYSKIKLLKNKYKNLYKPLLIEFDVETLGGYNVIENNDKRYINYHSGKINNIKLSSKIILKNNKNDPIYYAKKYLKKNNQFLLKYYNSISKKYL